MIENPATRFTITFPASKAGKFRCENGALLYGSQPLKTFPDRITIRFRRNAKFWKRRDFVSVKMRTTESFTCHLPSKFEQRQLRAKALGQSRYDTTANISEAFPSTTGVVLVIITSRILWRLWIRQYQCADFIFYTDRLFVRLPWPR